MTNQLLPHVDHVTKFSVIEPIVSIPVKSRKCRFHLKQISDQSCWWWWYKVGFLEKSSAHKNAEVRLSFKPFTEGGIKDLTFIQSLPTMPFEVHTVCADIWKWGLCCHSKLVELFGSSIIKLLILLIISPNVRSTGWSLLAFCVANFPFQSLEKACIDQSFLNKVVGRKTWGEYIEQGILKRKKNKGLS